MVHFLVAEVARLEWLIEGELSFLTFSVFKLEKISFLAYASGLVGSQV